LRRESYLALLIERPEVLPADPIRARPDGPLTVVRWSAATPLSGDYCLATTTARGNMVPATHGETVVAEALRELSPEERAQVAAAAALRSGWRTPRQRLRLARGPLAFLDPATLALAAPPGAEAPGGGPSAPAISVSVEGFERPWQPRPSLLDSRPDELVFRLEIDDAGDDAVVFGDDTFGRRPDEAARVTATYRVGGGAAGNVAAGTLVEPRPRPNESFAWLDAVTNPLPATGGRDPETTDHARRFGPASFQAPLVAVGPGDYQALAQSFLDAQARAPLQRARAAFRWTGSWLTATLAVDPRGTAELDEGLRAELLQFLEGRRLAGYDLAAIGARYVPVELEVAFCPAPGFRAADVAAELRRALGGGLLPDGRRAFFHPDNFSFGDSLFVSRLYAAIMAVPGVESARITRLARLRADESAEETAANLRQGALRVGADEIVRLDDDRNFPEHGSLVVRQVSAQDAIFRRAALARPTLSLRRLLSERE
ncbi:MAG TPA: hypothetical protein PKD53_31590, partial [Chloroflexaceae bacterium]|nr:hypothetical protein [Chloroflexaceae bacterium]